MACEDIKSKIESNRSVLDDLYQRKEAAFAQAQQAYQSYQFHKVQEGTKYSDRWVGFYDGKEFRDPKALEDYAKSVFDQKKATFEKLRDQFNAQVDVQDQLKKDLAACEASEAAKTKDNAGNGTPGSAPSSQAASGATGATGTTVPGASGTPTTPGATGATGPTNPVSSPPKPEGVGASGAVAASGAVGAGTTDPAAGASGTGQPKTNTNTGVAPQIKKAQAQASLQDTTKFGEQKDWRVRLQLSPGADYLYKAQNPGILQPLADSQGVIFPYTPSISVNYNANYGSVNPVHSNYKIIQYENSSVDSISISCDFTAQDTFEANYLLAVIHFFRSATKMFYGQDQNPKPGTPPPVCYLFGMGQFQFNAHPLVITSFGYNLPADVDYIRAGNSTAAGSSSSATKSPQKSFSLGQIIQNKIQGAISQGIAKIGNRIGIPLTAGGGLGGPTFQESFNYYNAVGTVDPTYVPTKINLSISCMPLISRYNTSNNFSIKDYASGKLLQGTKNPSGGFW